MSKLIAVQFVVESEDDFFASLEELKGSECGGYSDYAVAPFNDLEDDQEDYITAPNLSLDQLSFDMAFAESDIYHRDYSEDHYIDPFSSQTEEEQLISDYIGSPAYHADIFRLRTENDK